MDKDNKGLKGVDLLTNNLTHLLEQHNIYLKSIKQTLNVFLFMFIVNITVVVLLAFMLLSK